MQLQQAREEIKQIKDRDSDVYRIADNKRLSIENKIRLKLGLPEKPYNILDSDLKLLIQLDSGNYGKASSEFITSFSEDRGKMLEVEARIKEIIVTADRIKEREIQRIEFLENASYQIEQLAKFKPEAWIRDNAGHVIENENYTRWKSDIEGLSGKIDNRIKANQSIANEFPEERQDKRESLYLLQKKINELIEKHGLLKAGDK